MEDIIFFDNDNEEVDSVGNLKIGLFLNNNNLEKWFMGQVGDVAVAEIAKIFEKGTEDLDFTNLDALVLLRKNKSGGVEDPLKIAKSFIQENPNGLILFIVGTLDDEGKSMLGDMKDLGTSLFIAKSKGSKGQMGPDIVKKELDDLIQNWIKRNENQKNKISKVFLIKNAKGGCGATTISVHLANFLAENEKVLVIESRDSFKHHQLKNSIHVIQKEQLEERQLKEYQLAYPYIIIDDLYMDNMNNIETVMVIDGTPESLEKAKKYSSDTIIWNHACPDVIPKEVLEKELGAEILLEIMEDRPSFLQASITGEEVIHGINRLLQN